MNLKKIKKIIAENLNYFNQWKHNRKEYQYLKNLLKDVKREYILDKTIVFNTVRSFKNIFDRELFIAKLLALNGAKIVILLDNGILKHWDTITIDDFSNIHKLKKNSLNPYHFNYKNFFLSLLYRNSIKKALRTYRDKNLKIIYYNNILYDIDCKNWQEFAKFAKSSTIRFFKTSELDYKNKYVKYYYNLSLKNSILSRKVGEYILNELKPDIFVTSHGIYSTWGPCFEFLKENGIKSLVLAGVHGHSLKHNEIYFSDTILQTISRSSFWNNFKNKPINNKMRTIVENYFIKRINFSTTDTKVLYAGDKNLFQVNKNDGYKYHIAMFPNVIWDGNVEDRNIAFNGILDWLVTTIDYIKNRKDIKLFIKSHPSEITILKNSPKIMDLVKKQIKINEMNNIEIIPPEKKIDTYNFLKSGIDIGIVYDGLLGIEIPFLKIPTIICVHSGKFSVEGGNFPVKNKKEYIFYLDNIDKFIRDFHNNYEHFYENIIRYVYWYIFENPIILPTIKDWIKTDLLQLKKTDLILDKKMLNMFM